MLDVSHTTIPYLTVFLHKCGYLSLFGAFLRYLPRYAVPIWLAILAIGAAPTSAVDCYYSFAVDMNSFFFSSHGCVGTPVSAKSPLALMS